MAIVPDLSGVRPGRPGNLPLSDPHNAGKWELARYDNADYTNYSTTLATASQLVLPANPNRKALIIINPTGNSAMSLGVGNALASTAQGIPLPVGGGFQFDSKAPTDAIYIYGTVGNSVTILEG